MASWKPGGTCGLCGRMLEPDEPVTMTVVRVERDPDDRWSRTDDLRVVVCKPCSTNDRVGAFYGHHWSGWFRNEGVVSDGHTEARILGEVWCYENEATGESWTRCHQEESPHDHTIRMSDADTYIPHAPCEGCGRPVRTATRYSRKLGTRTVRYKRWETSSARCGW